MTEHWQLLAWPAGAVATALATFALRRPLTRLVTAAFAVPYSLTAEILSALQGGLVAYRGWWREQFETPTVRSFLGGALLGACLPALLWAEMHLQAPTVDALLQLEQGTVTLPFLAGPVEVTPGGAFVIAIILMEIVFGIVLLDALGATHFFPLADAAVEKRKVLALGAAAALLVCCVGQGALTAWRTIVTQQEMAVESAAAEPDGVLVVGSSDLLDAGDSAAREPSAPASAVVGASEVAQPDATAWLLRQVPWFVPAAFAFLLPLCAAAGGAAFYFVAVTVAAWCASIPILALALTGAALNWLLRAIGVAEALVQRLVEILAALGALLVRRRPPDEPIAEAPEVPQGAPVAEASPATGPAPPEPEAEASDDGAGDVLQSQMEEIETLRDRVRDYERRDRRERHRVQVDPFGIGAADDTTDTAEGRVE